MSPLDSIIQDQQGNGYQPTLAEMASGGYNHAQKWMNPQQTSLYPGQSPNAKQGTFGSIAEDDSPPGAPDYAKGPLANLPPTPAPTPVPQQTTAQAQPFQIDDNLLKRFTWSNAFNA